MTLQEACRLGEERLLKAEVPDARLDAWYLLEWAAGVSRSHYYAYPEEQLSSVQEQRYQEALARREQRVPLQHITGEQEFMGLTFRVNEHVLVPRQDTETLVELAGRTLKPGMRLLDLCTGSGCILLSLLHQCPEAEGVGSDLSEEALAVARDNAERLQIFARFVRSDLFAQVEGEFDLIVSNPPYIPTGEIALLQEEVRNHEPMLALDGHEDGLYYYRRIAKESLAHLKPGAALYLEIGYDQGESVPAILAEAGFAHIEVCPDLAGHDRVVKGVKHV